MEFGPVHPHSPEEGYSKQSTPWRKIRQKGMCQDSLPLAAAIEARAQVRGRKARGIDYLGAPTTTTGQSIIIFE
jgi:hypothetical protein